MSNKTLTLKVNGKVHLVKSPISISDFMKQIGIDTQKVAVEVNLEIVPKSKYNIVMLNDGDKLEIVHFIGGGSNSKLNDNKSTVSNDPFVVAGHHFKSRLILGTGKFQDYKQNAQAITAANADMVTVAIRRINLSDPSEPKLVDFIDPQKVTYLPNTAGCFNAEDALRTLRLARESGGWDLVKLEILGDKKTLYPKMPETLSATEVLVRENFKVMVYCSDDPIMCKRLEDAGASAIMPLGSLIGSGHGIQNPFNIGLIVEQSNVPVILDAGIGTPSEAAFAMELGCDGVIVNSAIASAQDPILMASGMRDAVNAGRKAFLAGRMEKAQYAIPSSPLSGLI